MAWIDHPTWQGGDRDSHRLHLAGKNAEENLKAHKTLQNHKIPNTRGQSGAGSSFHEQPQVSPALPLTAPAQLHSCPAPPQPSPGDAPAALDKEL